jgi:RimJ/RimL family protein N-acetyltransferase
MRLEAPTLTGRHVQLEPLRTDHAPQLLEAANRDRSSYGYTAVPATPAAMQAYVDALVDDYARGTVVPFAQRRRVDDRLVGCTRFMSLYWQPGRDLPIEVEVGGTWLAGDAQRSAVNTEAKLLLLTHAFDVLQVHRVAICTDARNERSRAAIERLGAHLEGVLRNHRLSMGELTEPGAPRDTAVHSIIADEWPSVRSRLGERLRERETRG